MRYETEHFGIEFCYQPHLPQRHILPAFIVTDMMHPGVEDKSKAFVVHVCWWCFHVVIVLHF